MQKITTIYVNKSLNLLFSTRYTSRGKKKTLLIRTHFYVCHPVVLIAMMKKLVTVKLTILTQYGHQENNIRFKKALYTIVLKILIFDLKY